MKVTSEPLELVSVEMEHTYKFCLKSQFFFTTELTKEDF